MKTKKVKNKADCIVSHTQRCADVTDLTLELCLQHLFLVVKLFLILPADALQPP